MLNDFTGADRVYIACGYTDLRKGINGLSALVQQQFNLDPFTNTLFLFCGRRRDRIKGLHRKLVKCSVLHADETTLRVLKEDGKAAASKSYMWLYRTSGDAA